MLFHPCYSIYNQLPRIIQSFILLCTNILIHSRLKTSLQHVLFVTAMCGRDRGLQYRYLRRTIYHILTCAERCRAHDTASLFRHISHLICRSDLQSTIENENQRHSGNLTLTRYSKFKDDMVESQLPSDRLFQKRQPTA